MKIPIKNALARATFLVACAFPAAQATAQGDAATESAMDFAAQAVNTQSPVKILEIHSESDAVLKSVRVQSSGEFSVATDRCDPPKNSKSCFIPVVFKPTLEGSTAGVITISSDGVAYPRTVRLSGSGQCGVDETRGRIAMLLSLALAFVVAFFLARWNLVAQPTRRLLVAQIDAVRARVASLSIPMPQVTELLDKAMLLATNQGPLHRTTEFLFWSRGSEIAAWGYVHEAEEQLTGYLTLHTLRESMATVEVDLRQLNSPQSIAMADRIKAELAAGNSAMPAYETMWMELAAYLRADLAAVGASIDRASASNDAVILRAELERWIPFVALKARALSAAQLIAQSPPAPGDGAIKALATEAIASLDAKTPDLLAKVRSHAANNEALPTDLQSALSEMKSALAPGSSAAGLLAQVSIRIQADRTDRLYRSRALIAEALALVYDEKDTAFATLMTWHNKSTWFLSIGMLLIVALGITLDHAVLFLVGAAGGVLSRLSRAVYATDVPTDYGASWTTLFLSPIVGALSGWGGILIAGLLVKLQILGPTIPANWCDPYNPLVLALALVLGFAERLFEGMVKPLQEKLGPQGAAPARPAPSQTGGVGSQASPQVNPAPSPIAPAPAPAKGGEVDASSKTQTSGGQG